MHPERYFFAVQLPIVQTRNTAFGLTKLAAAACMQCTAQKQQKAANTSLLESRSLLQTATLVFPRPIVCSRLSNNINILAKKLSGRQRGAMAPRPRAGSAIAGNVVTLFSWSGIQQDSLQAAMPRSVSTLKMGDAGRLDRDSQSTSSSPLCYIVKDMGQGQKS